MFERYIAPGIMFSMKYFFDIEKEISQQLLSDVTMKLNGVKETVAHWSHVRIFHK